MKKNGGANLDKAAIWVDLSERDDHVLIAGNGLSRAGSLCVEPTKQPSALTRFKLTHWLFADASLSRLGI